MRIDDLAANDQPAPRAVTAAFRAGRGWLPQSAGEPAALNPDAWARQWRPRRAGAGGASVLAATRQEMPR